MGGKYPIQGEFLSYLAAGRARVSHGFFLFFQHYLPRTLLLPRKDDPEEEGTIGLPTVCLEVSWDFFFLSERPPQFLGREGIIVPALQCLCQASFLQELEPQTPHRFPILEEDGTHRTPFFSFLFSTHRLIIHHTFEIYSVPQRSLLCGTQSRA